MAFTEVNSPNQRNSTAFSGNSGTLATPNNVVSGNLLIVAGNSWKLTTAPTSITVTSTRSDPLTVISAAATLGTNPAHRVWIAYGIATSSGACTFTINPEGGTGDTFCACDEFAANSPTLDVDGGSSNATSTTPADSITTLTANDLIVGSMVQEAFPVTLTAGGSWTLMGESEAAPETGSVEFGIVTTATSYSVDWTSDTNAEWLVVTAAFKEAVATGLKPKNLIIKEALFRAASW